MAPPKKRPDQRQPRGGERSKNVLALVPGQVEGEPAHQHWLKTTSDAWAAFWASDVAKVVTPEQTSAIRRLFDMKDVQFRAFERYRKQPYVDGSQGQPVTNPAFAEAMKLETAIVALEDRLGLTPKAQANLGIAIGQAALTAADLNAMAQEDDADTDDVLEVEGWETAN